MGAVMSLAILVVAWLSYRSLRLKKLHGGLNRKEKTSIHGPVAQALLPCDSLSVRQVDHGCITPFSSEILPDSGPSRSMGVDNFVCVREKRRASVQEHRYLRQRHDEIEAQLSSVGTTDPESVVLQLRRELEVMRARIIELQNAGFDEAPPSYVSEVG